MKLKCRLEKYFFDTTEEELRREESAKEIQVVKYQYWPRPTSPQEQAQKLSGTRRVAGKGLWSR